MRKSLSYLLPRGGSSVLIASVLFLALGQGQAPSKPGVVEAERFVLVDKQGRKRAEMFVDELDEATHFNMMDPRGKTRLQIGVHKEAATTLTFLDESERVRFSLGRNSLDQVGLSLLEPDGKVRVGLAIMEHGRAGLDVRDPKGFQRIGLLAEADGSSKLVFLDGDREPRMRLDLDQAGEASLQLVDEREITRASFQIDSRASPRLTFADGAGRPRLSLGIKTDTEGGLSVLKPDGKRLMTYLGMIEDSPVMSIYDRNEKARFLMRLSRVEEPQLLLLDTQERIRGWLRSGDDSNVSFGLSGTGDSPSRIALSVNDESPSWALFDEGNKKRCEAFIDSEGVTGIKLADKSEKELTKFTVDGAGRASLSALDDKGKALFKVP